MEELTGFIDNYYDKELDTVVPNIWEYAPATIEDRCAVYAQTLSSATKSSPQVDAIRVELMTDVPSVRDLVSVFTFDKLRTTWSQFLRTYKDLTPSDVLSSNLDEHIEYCIYQGSRKPLVSYLLKRVDYNVSEDEFVSTWNSVEWKELPTLPQLWEHFFRDQPMCKMERMYESGIHFKKQVNGQIKITFVSKYTNSLGYATPEHIAGMELSNLQKLVDVTKDYNTIVH